MPTLAAAPPARLVARLVDAWNAHDLDAIVALHAEDVEGEDVSEAAPLCGRRDVGRVAERYLQAFPDVELSVERLVVQGRALVVAWQARGTHDGPLLRIPPTHRVVTLRGLTMLDVEGGLVRRSRAVWDVAGLLRTLGLMPRL